MDANLLFNILIAFGTFQALFMALVLLGGLRKGLAKPLFAILLLIEGITLLERLLADTHWMEAVPHLLGISYPISFIQPPLILWTAKAIIDSHFQFNRKQLQLPKKYVSDIINQSMGCSFKVLLNNYRIEEALQIMQKNTNPSISLIDIAYSSGYTNKVSFYRSFKKKMGVAPSEYYQKLSATHL